MRLPIFPLGMVLLPGAPGGLHIFEPRYRQLVTDVLAGDRRFALAYLPPGTRELELAIGWPVCVAVIEEHEPLPDGRSNLVIRGAERVALAGFVASDAPYHVADLVPLPDTRPDPAAMAARLAEATAAYQRVVAAARIIADDTRDPAPLPADPAMVAYAMAASVDFEHPVQHRLLATRDPAERLAQLAALLVPAATDLERRAQLHGRAKTNGHGPH
jgi:Lon protease-like protein